jgi:hypothetical protein
MKANYHARDHAALTEARCLYTPPERLRELAMCEDVAVRSAVASHRFTRGDVLESMVQDDALCVRVSLAKNPRLPKAARRVLLRDDNVLFTFQCVLVDLYEHPERHYDWDFPIFVVARAYLRGAFRRLERPFPPDIAERIRKLDADGDQAGYGDLVVECHARCDRKTVRWDWAWSASIRPL